MIIVLILLLAVGGAVVMAIIVSTGSGDVVDGDVFNAADKADGGDPSVGGDGGSSGSGGAGGAGSSTRGGGGGGGSTRSGGGGGAGGSTGGGGGSGGGSSLSPFFPVVTTTSKVVRPTKSPPKVAKSVLLCTIGMNGILAAMMPPDGVCDFVFYTHAMCPNCSVNKRFTPLGDDTAYKVLLVKAKSYLVTTFGISLDQTAGEGLLFKDVYEACANAWKQNISHFGILNIRNLNNQAAVERSMKPLNAFNEFLKTKQAAHRGKLHVAVAAWTETGHIASAPRLLATAVNPGGEFSFVTIVIVKSHVTHWQYVPLGDIKPVGPNTRTKQPIPSQPTSFVVGPALKAAKIDTTNRYVMMSFTMGSAGFRMPDSWYEGLLDVPVVHSLMFYPQACIKDIGPELDTDVDMSKRKENNTLHFLIMYDNHQLFKAKAEIFYDKYLESSGSGIAAFDLEYDDFANLCGEGSFRRLKAIKDVVRTKA